MTIRNVGYKGGDPEWARAVEDELAELRREVIDLRVMVSQAGRN